MKQYANFLAAKSLVVTRTIRSTVHNKDNHPFGIALDRAQNDICTSMTYKEFDYAGYGDPNNFSNVVCSFRPTLSRLLIDMIILAIELTGSCLVTPALRLSILPIIFPPVIFIFEPLMISIGPQCGRTCESLTCSAAHVHHD